MLAEGEAQTALAAAQPEGDPASQHIGRPYQIAGNWYRPQAEPDYDRTGTASWYGPRFHGRRTANGEVFDQRALSAAHPTLPLPSYVRVTNLDNDRSLVVRVNDRGPFHPGRLIDVSERAAELLDFKRSGSAAVRVEYVDAADPDGGDEPYLVASYEGPNGYPSVEDASAVAIAGAAPPRRRELRPAASEPVAIAVASVAAAAPAPAPAPAVAALPSPRRNRRLWPSSPFRRRRVARRARRSAPSPNPSAPTTASRWSSS